MSLLKATLQKLESCEEVNKEILKIINSKKTFPTDQDMIDFARNKFGFKLIGKSRSTLSTNLTKFLMGKGIETSNLHEILDISPPKKKETTPKIKKTTSSKKKSSTTKNNVTSQFNRWVSIPESELRIELEDKSLYKTLTDLRNAAGPLLTKDEGRNLKRDALIELILTNFRNKKAISQFGR